MEYLCKFGHSVRNRVLRHFPRFSLRTLAFLSCLRHRFPTALRHELELNLSLAYPALGRREITRLARSILVANLVDAAAQFRLELLSKEALCKETMAVRITGWEHLERACAAGQPVILVTPHYGSFMQAALRVALEQQGKPVYFFYNPSERNPYADTSDVLIDRIDDRCVKIHHDRKGVITALRALKKGAMLCIMPDQITPEGEVVYVPFFGRFFSVMQGVAFFALKANAKIIPLYCFASAGGEQVLEYRAPIAVMADPSLGGEARLYQITMALFCEIERQFRQAPAHWRYWTQFRSRSFSSPLPPKSYADLVTQLEEVHRGVADNSSAAGIISDWRKHLRDIGQSA